MGRRGYRTRDSGFTDVVAFAATDSTKPKSYSSSRYYETSKIFLSRRRTDKWNTDAAEVVKDMPTDRTATLACFEELATRYLAGVEEVLRHRFEKRYRNMRFMRSVHKRRAVEAICSFIADT